MGKWTTSKTLEIRLGSEGWCRSPESAAWPKKIEALLQQGKTVKEIASEVGCSEHTVYRYKKRLAQELS